MDKRTEGLSNEELLEVDEGFKRWWAYFDLNMYQSDYERLKYCLPNLHQMLHITQSINHNGPLWVYWQYQMEDLCGKLRPLIHTKSHPYRNLGNNILLDQQLRMLTDEIVEEQPIILGMLFEAIDFYLNQDQLLALEYYYNIQRTEANYSRLIPAQNVAPSNDITKYGAYRTQNESQCGSKYRRDKYNHKRCNHIIQARLSVFDRDDAERVQTFYYMYNEFN